MNVKTSIGNNGTILVFPDSVKLNISDKDLKKSEEESNEWKRSEEVRDGTKYIVYTSETIFKPILSIIIPEDIEEGIKEHLIG